MLNKKQIVARITSHSKSARKLREEIQVTLCEIAGHIVQHGEVSLYQALLNSVQGVNRVGIHNWIREYGGALLKDEKLVKNDAWLKEHRNGAKTLEECLAARVAKMASAGRSIAASRLRPASPWSPVARTATLRRSTPSSPAAGSPRSPTLAPRSSCA